MPISERALDMVLPGFLKSIYAVGNTCYWWRLLAVMRRRLMTMKFRKGQPEMVRKWVAEMSTKATFSEECEVRR